MKVRGTVAAALCVALGCMVLLPEGWGTEGKSHGVDREVYREFMAWWVGDIHDLGEYFVEQQNLF